MEHLQPFEPRTVLFLPTVKNSEWQLKRYCILAPGKEFDQKTADAALYSATQRLPAAGKINDASGNHGVGFQLIHFAQIAIVSPVFYWMWGSVLANTVQMRAPLDNPEQFETGVKEVVGCIWEMQIVSFETQAWTQTMLGGNGDSSKNLSRYLDSTLTSSRSIT